MWTEGEVGANLYLLRGYHKHPGGGVLPYISHIGMCHRVGFLRCFGLKTGQHFAHFGLESGMVL